MLRVCGFQQDVRQLCLQANMASCRPRVDHVIRLRSAATLAVCKACSATTLLQAHPEVSLEAPRFCAVVRFAAQNRGYGCSATVAADRTSEPFMTCQTHLSQPNYEAAQYQGLLLGLVAALRNQAADIVIFGFDNATIHQVRRPPRRRCPCSWRDCSSRAQGGLQRRFACQTHRQHMCLVQEVVDAMHAPWHVSRTAVAHGPHAPAF